MAAWLFRLFSKHNGPTVASITSRPKKEVLFFLVHRFPTLEVDRHQQQLISSRLYSKKTSKLGWSVSVCLIIYAVVARVLMEKELIWAEVRFVSFYLLLLQKPFGSLVRCWLARIIPRSRLRVCWWSRWFILLWQCCDSAVTVLWQCSKSSQLARRPSTHFAIFWTRFGTRCL